MAHAPVYLLAGNPRARTSDPILRTVIESAGKSKPAIAYLGSASRDNRVFFSMIALMLKASGAGTVILAPTASRRFNHEKTATILTQSDMVFVSGGDVEEGMRILHERNLIPPLRELFDTGKPFFGVSAGSIMLCRQWVRWRDPNDDATAETFPCLGFCPILCDTHAEEDGWQELKTLLRLCPEGTEGWAIPSGGGIRVEPDGEVKIILGAVRTLTHERK
jgi:peptidase E